MAWVGGWSWRRTNKWLVAEMRYFSMHSSTQVSSETRSRAHGQPPQGGHACPSPPRGLWALSPSRACGWEDLACSPPNHRVPCPSPFAPSGKASAHPLHPPRTHSNFPLNQARWPPQPTPAPPPSTRSSVPCLRPPSCPSPSNAPRVPPTLRAWARRGRPASRAGSGPATGARLGVWSGTL